MALRDTVQHNRLVDIARLYYLHNMTHQQIADRLSLSRIKVTRLLQKAVEERIVEFRIADALLQPLELQDALERRFGLNRAIVAPTAENDEQTMRMVGRFGADYLRSNLRDGLTIGIGWGRTLNVMCDALEPKRFRDINVVSMSGGLAANANQPNPYDVTTAIASKLGGRPHYLLLPAIVESPMVMELMMREQNVRAIQPWWQKLDIAMVSIGAISSETGVFYSFAHPEREARKVRGLGGVGDILTRAFDVNGKLVKTEFADRTLTIDFHILRNGPIVVGVAGGIQKAEAILGALRTGLLKVLVTDEKTAQKALELDGGT